MTSMLDFNMTIFLISQIISGFIVGFMMWRKRELLKVRSEKVFNYMFLYIIFSILVGRLSYVVQNFDQFEQISWSIYPYYFDPGAERVWLRQMPWIILKFWDNGINYSMLLFGGALFTAIYYKIAHIENIKVYLNIAMVSLCVGQIIQIIGFFIGGFYIGKLTDSFIGIKYIGYDANRIPVQLIEVAAMIIMILIFNYLKKIKKSSLIFGLYFFIFSWLEIVVDYLKDYGDEIEPKAGYIDIYGVNSTQVFYLFVILISILIIVFSYQGGGLYSLEERESIKSNQGFNKDNQMESGSGKVRNIKKTFSYKDFRSSYSTYRKSRVSLFAWLKRNLFRKRKSDSDT